MSSNLGSINERGIIKGFERKGFTPEKCLSEIVANSIDAGAAKIMYQDFLANGFVAQSDFNGV